MTGAELVGIREVQEVTKQRKARKKGPGKGKGKSKAKKESSDESDAYVDVTGNEVVEIFDCIEVEM
jgi:ribosomal protein L19E